MFIERTEGGELIYLIEDDKGETQLDLFYTWQGYPAVRVDISGNVKAREDIKSNQGRIFGTDFFTVAGLGGY